MPAYHEICIGIVIDVFMKFVRANNTPDFINFAVLDNSRCPELGSEKNHLEPIVEQELLIARNTVVLFCTVDNI